MPRWPEGYIPRRRQTCPVCGGAKDFYAKSCRRCSEPAKPLAGVTGESHPAWRGGQIVDRDGYIRTYAPGHPWPRRGGYIMEHVRVVELAIGRRIEAGEVVHHIDGDRRNNAIENLQVMTAGDHSRHHRTSESRPRERDASGRFAPRKEVQDASSR